MFRGVRTRWRDGQIVQRVRTRWRDGLVRAGISEELARES